MSDALAQELRVYDAAGTYVRTIGQRGEGPGEFASAPAIVGLAGDTGELLGTVHTPPDTRLLAIHDDFVVGVVLDEFDVPYVRRHALLSSSEGGT
ncbi:MAG: 6-bladed beta-propeller [Gemmatimonadota bacterium]|nr:6-bladed beta-propeller [Gemmatimonadota bacterium]